VVSQQLPGAPENATQPPIYYENIAGHLGRLLEFVFAPIGFNWQICIALVPGLAAREVAVAALGTVYALSQSGDELSSMLESLIAQSWSLLDRLIFIGLVCLRAAMYRNLECGKA
jgi:ferrous iron transport protein B